MIPLEIIARLAAEQGNPALPLMVPAVVRAALDACGTPAYGEDAAWAFNFTRVEDVLEQMHDSGAIELRPDAGNVLSPDDLALCPRGAGGVPLVTLVLREVPK